MSCRRASVPHVTASPLYDTPFPARGQNRERRRYRLGSERQLRVRSYWFSIGFTSR